MSIENFYATKTGRFIGKHRHNIIQSVKITFIYIRVRTYLNTFNVVKCSNICVLCRILEPNLFVPITILRSMFSSVYVIIVLTIYNVIPYTYIQFYNSSQYFFNSEFESMYSSEKVLKGILNEYYQQTRLKDMQIMKSHDVNKFPSDKFGLHSYNGKFNKLGYGIYFVLQQLSNYKLQKLPERNAIDVNKNYMFKLSDDYEENICSLVPRCLDFVHIYTNNMKLLVSSYKLHAKLCRSWQILMEQICSLVNPKSKYYSCNDESIIALHYKIFKRN